MTISKNLHIFASNLADSCLIYLLYQKILKQISFNNIIYIHFDKQKPQAAMYFEGVITENVSSLEYGILNSLLRYIEKLNREHRQCDKLHVSCNSIIRKFRV